MGYYVEEWEVIIGQRRSTGRHYLDFYNKQLRVICYATGEIS